ncbi:MAG: gluconeogenesis factor YvcK family protein [Anaerolineae bacterium]
MAWLKGIRLPRGPALPGRGAWRWLYLGLGVKRWLVLLFIGVTLLSLGTALFLVGIYRELAFPPFVYYLTLQFIPRELRAVILGLAGVALVLFAIWKLNQSLLSAVAPRETSLVDALYRRRRRQQGIKLVVIGGGTGMSTLLRGLKTYTENLAAIITVADDGGSSGRLRRELGLLPPGDFRQCLAALADAEPLMGHLFEYRFAEGTGISGHAFGNLFIAAMAGITGNFEKALLESSRVLAVRGKILPSTLENVTLGAEVRGSAERQWARVMGESQIAKFGQPVERVFLDPEHVPAYPGAVRVILEADLIIAGPGSLFTSVIPNLLVDDIRRALQSSPARKIYICNVATEHGETDGYSLQDHVAALEAHTGGPLFTTVFANDNWRGQLPPLAQIEFVRPRGQSAPPYQYVFVDVVDEQYPWRHDPEKLAREVLRWYARTNKGPESPLSHTSNTLEEQWQHV